MTVFAVLDILIDPDNQSSAGSRSLSGLRTSMTSGSSFGPVPTESRTEFLRERIVVIEAKDATLGMLAGHDHRVVPTKRALARDVWGFTPVWFPFTPSNVLNSALLLVVWLHRCNSVILTQLVCYRDAQHHK